MNLYAGTFGVHIGLPANISAGVITKSRLNCLEIELMITEIDFMNDSCLLPPIDKDVSCKCFCCL